MGAVRGAVEGVDNGPLSDGGWEGIEGVLDNSGAVGAGESGGGRIRFAGDGQARQRDACVALLLVGVGGGDAVENLSAYDVCSCEVVKRDEGVGPATGDAMTDPCGC
ncbi:hypothetical protein WDU99_16940 [Microbacterium sp. Mu-80]|uniref:Uncharacterized protein n=1 Tax=Microbacterium bandirmense TaxID=3122050 RepID=A0ABU8LF87_9MICO